jgi:SAM-dependent methyltransferase
MTAALDAELTAAGEDLRAMANGFQAARVLSLAVEVGIFEQLTSGPQTAAAVAAELSLDPRGAEIVLDALTALELLSKDGATYDNSAAAATFLVRDAPHSMAFIAGHRAEMFRSWALLDRVLREGPQVDEAAKATLSDPETNRNFIRGMAEVSRGRLGPILDRLPLAEARHFVDLGGGPAQYCCEAVRRHAQLAATLIDLPLTVEVAKEYIAEQGLSEQVDTLVCDFFDAELSLGDRPPADVVLISQVLHAEGPERNAALIAKAARVLAPGGTLAIVENLVDEDRSKPAAAALFAVNMLAGTARGRTYTAAEVGSWLASAGLEVMPLEPIEPRTQLLRGLKPSA